MMAGGVMVMMGAAIEIWGRKTFDQLVAGVGVEERGPWFFFSLSFKKRKEREEEEWRLMS